MLMISFYGRISFDSSFDKKLFFLLLSRSIHKSNMENLILYCGNKAQGDERIMNILEIVVLMLREQVDK